MSFKVDMSQVSLRSRQEARARFEKRTSLISALKPLLPALAIGALLLPASCSRGPRIALDPESAGFYEMAQLIMTGEEKDIFNNLPDAESRREFIADFWHKRDPDYDTEENEFKDEFYARIEYANQRFKEGTPGWKTDRGRIYIFMGPPDKFEEFFTHGDPNVRGPILWWAYYEYQLGIEFVDERNDGSYRIRRYDGNFFEALDSLMLGRVPYRTGSARKFVNFKVDYNSQKKEIEVRLPAEAMSFQDEGEMQRADFEFQVYVYNKGGVKVEEFKDEKTFRIPLADLVDVKEVVIPLSREFPPGEYYLDMIIIGKSGALGKTRKIVDLKIK
jgi:GWxTD domain-containing protein